MTAIIHIPDSDGSCAVSIRSGGNGNNWIPMVHLVKLFEDKITDLNVAGLLRLLRTDPSTGIDANSIPMRVRMYGSNALPPPIMKSYLRFLYEAMKERMVVFLLLAASVTVGIGVYETINGQANAWLEGVVIVIAIAVITGVNSVNDYRKQARFRKLNDYNVALRMAKVMRDGKVIQIPIEELVVGDIMEITMGDILACDALLLQGNSVKTDESGITGESRQIPKQPLSVVGEQEWSDSGSNHERTRHANHESAPSDAEREPKRDPYLISGTTVIDGNGTAVVLLIGENSVHGRTMAQVQVDPPPTPLQIKLGKLAKKLATIGLVVAAITLTALIAIFFIKRRTSNDGTAIIDALLSVIFIGISILVMSIPEGLPLAVTLSLAYATIHMLKDKNLVRHLNACETMGGATTVCSDKTGTLTVNKMTVVRAQAFSTFTYDHRSADADEILTAVGNCSTFDEFALGLMVNTEAYEAVVANKMRFLGSQTEVGLLEWLRKIQPTLDYKAARKDTKVIQKIPFNSDRKRSSVSVMLGSRRVTFTKGASEIVLSICDRVVDENGMIRYLTPDDVQHYETVISNMASDSLRTICVAYREMKPRDAGDDYRDFIFYGVFALEDPLRDNAKQSVQRCQQGGVIVRMVTGDNLVTARSIAKQCGIVQNARDVIIEGPEFRRIMEQNDSNIISGLLPNLRVMARSSPNDKLLLVNALKDMGETVAVTGDGANDGPALKSSHVGFSMGISGTEVAKEASDIVLLDDDFASIVHAILWGRAIYMGIQKFIMFQLSVNISSVFITIVTSLESTIALGAPVAGLTALQILYLNLVADTLAAMALSTDKPEPSLLNRKPRRQTDPIITRNMWKMILAQSMYQIVIGLLLYYVGPFLYGSAPGLRGSILFNAFVYMVLFNELNCRSLDKDYNVFSGITRNRFFLPLFLIGFIIQFPIVTYLGIIFDTVPISWVWWLVSIALGTGSLLVGLVVRAI